MKYVIPVTFDQTISFLITSVFFSLINFIISKINSFHGINVYSLFRVGALTSTFTKFLNIAFQVINVGLLVHIIINVVVYLSLQQYTLILNRILIGGYKIQKM